MYDERGGKIIIFYILFLFFFGSVVNYVVVVTFQYGEFLQSVGNLSAVVNKIETHPSDGIRNETVLP